LSHLLCNNTNYMEHDKSRETIVLPPSPFQQPAEQIERSVFVPQGEVFVANAETIQPKMPGPVGTDTRTHGNRVSGTNPSTRARRRTLPHPKSLSALA